MRRGNPASRVVWISTCSFDPRQFILLSADRPALIAAPVPLVCRLDEGWQDIRCAGSRVEDFSFAFHLTRERPLTRVSFSFITCT